MLLDSNILIYAANETDTHHSISSLVRQPDMHISSITKLEVFGYHKLKEKEEIALEALLENMAILPIMDETIDDAIQLRQQKSMSVGDAIIAATALKYGLTLATRNTGDFSWIEGLTLVNPFDV